MQEAALESSNTAILINPNYADAIGLKASILNNLERPEEALRRWIRQKINPNFPVEYLQIETIFYMMLGQQEAAKELTTLALERLPESRGGREHLICADTFLDNIDDALWNRDELLINYPNFDINSLTFNENITL